MTISGKVSGFFEFWFFLKILKISKQSCNGKVVSILEGGYDLNALAESANEHVNALLEFNWYLKIIY